MLRSAKMRMMRQKPARLPYSNCNSIERSRPPWIGMPPGVSHKNTSDAASPFRMLFSPPSS